MKTIFETKEDAIKYGYSEVVKGDKDISGGHSFGYKFERNGQKTVIVTFTKEANKIRQMGAAAPMFPPKAA